MELTGLVQLERTEKEIVISDKLRLKLHTLSVGEQQKVLRDVPLDITDSLKFTYFQISILKHATTCINDQKFELKELTEFYSNLQAPLLIKIFEEYQKLFSDQEKVQDELSKKEQNLPFRELWIAAKVLHISPFDERINDLSKLQLTWLLANYFEDKREEFENIKLLCRFVNPEAAKKVFDTVETHGEVDLSNIFEEIKQHTTANITVEEFKDKLEHPPTDTDDITTITRVD